MSMLNDSLYLLDIASPFSRQSKSKKRSLKRKNSFHNSDLD